MRCGVAEDRLGLGHDGLEHVDAEAAEEAEVHGAGVGVVARCRCCGGGRRWWRGCCSLLLRFHSTQFYYVCLCVVLSWKRHWGLPFIVVFRGIRSCLRTNRFKTVCGTRAQNATVRPTFLWPKSNGVARAQNATVRRVFLRGGAGARHSLSTRGHRRGRGRPARRPGGRPAPRGRGRRGTSGRRC